MTTPRFPTRHLWGTPEKVMKPNDRVAVVTGGTAGVGRATVRLLAEQGWDVAILARGQDRLEATAQEVTEAGRRAVSLSVDVADADAVDRAASHVEDTLGPIDAWINNAFAGFLAPFDDVSADEYHRVTDVTYHGQVHGTWAALRRMKKRDRGVIIQVGSALAFRGIPLQSAYCGAKHAIVGFTESLRTELKHERSRVKVCMVHLPALNTPQFDWALNRMPQHPMPVPPIYQPEVAARAIAHVASHPRRTTWVGMPTVLTILGNRIAPALLDVYLGRTGYNAQQADRPPSDEPPNLFTPVDGDHAAHGSFDDQAHAHSAESWLSRHRTPIALAGAALVASGVARKVVD